ncbi:MAG: cysteine peptidase family C39 domain-containing protein [Planctomycetota bacterium]|jgi:hypothetical protein
MSDRADLWIAALVMLLLSGGLCAATWALAKGLSKKQLTLLGICSTIGILAFGAFLSDSPWIASVIPAHAIVVYGNLMPLLAGPLVGIVLRSGLALRRRLLPTAALVLIGGYSLCAPLLKEVPTCADRWKDGVCLQTSQASCAPAAAATLLAHYGIRASEQEMARLCLTDRSGTRFHGLCRGLRIKTEGTARHMKIGTGSVEDLRTGVELPALVYVKLTPEVDRRDRRYSTEWGWIVGVTHTVVVFAFPNEKKVDVGDPAFGRERWGIEAFQDLCTGRFIVLVARQR